MRIYVLLRVVRVFLSILCLLVGLITVIWDQLQVHRLKSTEDLHRLIQVHKLEKIDDRCRIVNSTHFQCLPNVFIIGASKAGTTSLVHYLRQLPRVHFVRRHISTHIDNHSEIHLFDRPNYGRSWKSIDMAVEWASCPIVPSTEDVVVHYTPHYLYAPSVPFDIKKIYPAVSRIKFIVLLRDPLERSLSSYWFKNSHLLKEVDSGNIQDFVAGAEAEKILRHNFETCMLRKFFEEGQPGDEINRTSTNTTSIRYLQLTYNFLVNAYNGKLPCLASNFRFQGYPSSPPRIQDSSKVKYSQALESCFGGNFRKASLGLRHLDKSIYFDQLVRWMLNFHPSQMLVIPSASFFSNPRAIMQTILDFTTSAQIVEENKEVLDYIDFSTKLLQNPNKYSLESPLDSSIASSLHDYFSPFEAASESLLCSTNRITI